MKKIIKEEVITLDIIAGTNVAVVEPTTSSDGTSVIQCAIYKSGGANAGLVQASIAVDGIMVSEMQPIDNYRSREAAYLENKPCHFESGKRIRFEVRADQNFTTNGKIILILVKEKIDC